LSVDVMVRGAILPTAFVLCAFLFAQEGSENTEVEKLVHRALSSTGEERAKAITALADSGYLAINALKQIKGDDSEEAKKVLEEIASIWVSWLESKDGGKRSLAEGYLYEAQDSAVKALKAAAEGNGSLHLKTTAKRLLEMVRFRISPELYRRIGGVFADYDRLSVRERLSAVFTLEQMGGREAIEALKRVVLEDKDEMVRIAAADALVRTGDISVLKFVKEQGLSDKISAPPDRYILMLSQGIRFMQIEDYKNAIEEFTKILQEYPDDYRANYELAMCYLLSKEYHNSLKHFKICLKERPNDSVLHYNIACAYALLGHKDEAFEHLEKAVDFGYCDATHTEADEDLRGLRDDERFKKLLERMRNDGRDGRK